MSLLVYRRPCEHGDLERHFLFSEGQDICPGFIDVPLDPHKVLMSAGPHWNYRVLDVLDVLDREAT